MRDKKKIKKIHLFLYRLTVLEQMKNVSPFLICCITGNTALPKIRSSSLYHYSHMIKFLDKKNLLTYKTN